MGETDKSSAKPSGSPSLSLSGLSSDALEVIYRAVHRSTERVWILCFGVMLICLAYGLTGQGRPTPQRILVTIVITLAYMAFLLRWLMKPGKELWDALQRELGEVKAKEIKRQYHDSWASTGDIASAAGVSILVFLLLSWIL